MESFHNIKKIISIQNYTYLTGITCKFSSRSDIKNQKNWLTLKLLKGVYDSDLIKALEALKMLQIDTG